MQYIEKGEKEPTEWNDFFRGGSERVYKFKYATSTKGAKAYLLKEQHGLCAYCQSPLMEDDSSIEHVVPNSQNDKLSTLYHNLVVVCKEPAKDQNGRSHCDKERGDKLIPALIFYKKAQVAHDSHHGFIDAYADGTVVAKHNLDNSTKNQVQAFVDVLHLNHKDLVGKRNDGWMSITKVFAHVQPHQRKAFWENQLNSILKDMEKPYRQYLAILVMKKLF